MFCKNCGYQIADGAAFCPNCGELNNVEKQQNLDLFNTIPKTTVEPTKSIMKPVIAVIAALVFVGAVVVGIIFGINAFNKPDYAENNAFAKTAKNVEKDSEQYHLLNAFASVQNLLFNSESFEFEFDIASVSMDGKFVFGKDISSSQIIFDAEDEIYAALFNGLFEASDGDYGIEIDIANVLKGTKDFEVEFLEQCEEMLEKRKEDLRNMKENSSAYYDESYIEMQENSIEAFELMIDRVRENFPAIEKAVHNIVSDNHLSYDSLAELYANVVVPYMEAGLASRGIDGISIPSFDFLWETVADFLANGIDEEDVQVDVEEEGRGKEAVVRYDIKCDLVDILNAFYDYASKNENIIAVFGDKADELIEEIESELEYINEANISEKIKFSIETKNGYLTKFEMKLYDETIQLVFKNINNTVITDNEYDNIKSDIDDADDFYTISDMDDILEEIF